MSLLKYKATLKKWDLAENPFRSNPPGDLSTLAQIFYGREAEIERAILPLYEGRNVLIRGAWGIGKTALILTLLHNLQQEVSNLNEKMLVLYLGNVPGDNPTDFYRALVLAVADALKEEDEEAAAIADGIRGLSVQPTKMNKEGKVTLGFVSFGSRQESSDDLQVSSTADPYSLLIPLLEKAETYFSRLVLAVDDLDKKDIPVVQEILERSLDLFRRGEKRSFLMTGRGFTDLQEATLQALGIFSEDISLEQMKKEDLRQIVINYLNTVRNNPRNDCYPFNDEVMDLITDYAQGTPRQLNTICEKVLRKAAQGEKEEINLPVFDEIWKSVRKDVTYGLTPHLRRLLYVVYEAGGIDEDIADEYLERLEALTFIELLPMLKNLEEQEFLIRTENEDGFRFLPSKLFLPPSDREAE